MSADAPLEVTLYAWEVRYHVGRARRPGMGLDISAVGNIVTVTPRSMECTCRKESKRGDKAPCEHMLATRDCMVKTGLARSVESDPR